MNKSKLIQEIFRKTDFTTYLEIGTATGKSFLPIIAKCKTAVDPHFKIPFKRKLKWILKNPTNFKNKYFEEDSDSFFAKRKAYLDKIAPLDIVLVDGLHTFNNSLKDVLNSLKYLNPDGLIIMHDCFPPTRAAALPTKHFPTPDDVKDLEEWDNAWCGDVWKSIVYLRKMFPDELEVCVINTDFGLGIVTFKDKIKPDRLVIDEKTFDEINTLTYDDLKRDPITLINLKNADEAESLIERVVKSDKK